jgi:hypothetical protein
MLAAMMAFIMILCIISLVIALIALISMWLIFEKANQPGWAAIIPIYNTIVQLGVIGRKWPRIFVYLIPLYNIYALIVDTNRLSKSFGYSSMFTVGLIFFPYIFLSILGFGKAKYVGPNGVATPVSN